MKNKKNNINKKPRLAIFIWEPCSWKSTIIKNNYLNWYEYVDAWNEFLKLSDWERLEFEWNILKCMKLELFINTNDAIKKKSDLVVELCIWSYDEEILKILMDLYNEAWYEIEINPIVSNIDDTIKWAEKRNEEWENWIWDDFISSYFYTNYNLYALISWIIGFWELKKDYSYLLEEKDLSLLEDSLKTENIWKFKVPKKWFWVWFYNEKSSSFVEISWVDEIEKYL